MLLSIIIPVYNEERLVCELLSRVLYLKLDDGIGMEVIVVDDGSSDDTTRNVAEFIAKNGPLDLSLIRHERNRGKGAAVKTGMAAANGDLMIIQDADLEYEPEDIREVIHPVLSGETMVCYGSRILKEKALGRAGICGVLTGKHPDSYFLAYLGGVSITKWINLLTGSKLTDEPTCYKCFHRNALVGLTIEHDDFAWEPEVTVKLLIRGHRIKEVPVSYHPRKRDEGKKINWKDGAKALWVALMVAREE
jgi:glycosyltransferase involved in cell wall biosynthesis